jgi:hypothetical protein
MFKPNYQYKKAGIMLSEISPVTHRQGDLLEGDVSSNGKSMLSRLGYLESALWEGYGQGVDAGGIPGLADAAGAQVTEPHVGSG